MSSNFVIPFSKPLVGDDELQAVKRVFESGWLTTAQETLLFEKEFEAYISSGISSHVSNGKTAKNYRALAVQSASAGLHLCLQALGVKEGDKVVTTPFTFVATASSILHTGAEPVFIDCAKQGLQPEVEQLEKLEKDSRLKVFMPVHICGCVHDASIIDYARSRNFAIVEDAAHCFPAHDTNTGDYVGLSGDAGVFSFYANKTITTAEGGMVVSDNQELTNTIATLRNHGISKPVWNRYTQNSVSHDYDIEDLGYKYNLPDVLSAIGRVQLQKAADLHQKRIKIAKYYFERLSDIEYITLPNKPSDMNTHSWHLFVIRVKHPKILRDELMQKLAEKGIGTSVHYKPLHLMTYYQKRFGFSPKDFPNAVSAYNEVLSIPIYPSLRSDELEQVCDTIINIIR